MPNDHECEMKARIEALEKANEQHGNTHREIFGRLNKVETDNAVQNAQYSAIIEKLDSLADKHDRLNAKLEELEKKPVRRWEAIVDKAIWAVCAAVIAFVLGRVGL